MSHQQTESVPDVGNPVPSPPLPVIGIHDAIAIQENSSGTRGEVPQEATGWNWGAFFFTWIWLFAHRMPGYAIAFLLLVVLPCAALFYRDLPVGPENGLFLTAALILGANGNRLAWRHRRFDSLEHFQQTERVWAYWGLAMVVAVIARIILKIVDAIY